MEAEPLADVIQRINITDRKRATLDEDLSQQIYDIIAQLEKEKGSPPQWLEVQKAIKANEELAERLLKVTRIGKLNQSALIWQDKVYYTEDTTYFSMGKYNEHFAKFSERHQARYGAEGYQLDSLQRVVAGLDTKTVNYG